MQLSKDEFTNLMIHIKNLAEHHSDYSVNEAMVFLEKELELLDPKKLVVLASP